MADGQTTGAGDDGQTVPDDIEFADDEVVPIRELVELYESVNWLRYSTDPDGLARAVDRSTYVVTARDGDGELVGLVRCLTDDVSILHIQDVLVRPERQRQGIGRFLLLVVLQRFRHVRQRVLLTDDEPRQLAFYRSLGFENVRDFGPPVVNAFVQFRPDQPD
ncbi:MAG: GNAT family N-acetyltransferase [Actinomycetota bacterium]